MVGDNELGVGLDLATRQSGVFFGRGDRFLEGRVLAVKTEDGHGDWLQMADLVDKLLNDTNPAYVCIEDTHYNKNAATLRLLSMLSGAVRYMCHVRQAPCYVATTAEIDSACGIPARLARPRRKRELTAFAQRLGFTVPQDVADALAVLFWGMGQRRIDNLVPNGKNNVGV